MPLETGNYISDLVITNPDGADSRVSADDHLRLIKKTVKGTFANVTGAVTASHTELNLLTGKTSVVDNAQLTATAFNAALPSQTGNAGKFVTTDGTNASWAFAGISDVNATITDNATLTGSYKYVPVAMTAMGKSVTLPAATGLSKGGPQFIIKNDGGYPFGVRDNTGTLLTAVAAGGVAYLTLKDNTTAAGSWSVIGDNLEPGLITIDNTFSSTYSSTVLAPFVALDSNTSIHFAARPSTGFSAFVVDNANKVVGTPTAVDTGTSASVQTAFKVSATQAIVFYTNGTNACAAVLTVAGSAVTMGSLSFVSGLTSWAGEDFVGAPKVVQLSATSYLASYTNGANTSVVALSVSGTTVTIGTPVNIITSGSIANSTTAYALTATTALVIYKTGTNPYPISAVVVSVSGTTCTVGTPATAPNGSTSSGAPASCMASATKVWVACPAQGNSYPNPYCITISGTTVSFSALLAIESLDMSSSLDYTSSSATRYNPHLFPLSASTALLWYLDSGGISRAVVLTESGGTVTAGAILYNSISLGTVANSYAGKPLAFGTSDFLSIMQMGSAGSSQPYSFTASTHKISGTTVTLGTSELVPEHAPEVNMSFSTGARLASGDYVISCRNTSMNTALPVFRSNGDSLVKRGKISLPKFIGVNVDVIPVVSSNRLVLVARSLSSTNGANVYSLRLLNVEIAA